jgi:hypothetical protein
VALGAVYTAIKALLAADGTTTALLATAPTGFGGGPAIYDEGAAPSAATMPYLTIGAGTMVPFDTFRSMGWNCTLQIKVVGIGSGVGSEAAGQAIVAALAALLSRGRALTVTGYTSSWCDEFVVQPSFVSVVAGVTVREWPVILRVYAT